MSWWESAWPGVGVPIAVNPEVPWQRQKSDDATEHLFGLFFVSPLPRFSRWNRRWTAWQSVEMLGDLQGVVLFHNN